MSVLLETSLGDLTVDLLTEECPLTCENFLKLCKVKYYNDSLFHRIERDFLTITGLTKDASFKSVDQIGHTVWNLIDDRFAGVFDDKPEEKYLKYIPDQINHDRKHDVIGVVATANERHNRNGSGFYITLAPNLASLDGKHTIFGLVVEGIDSVLLSKFNKCLTDEKSVPLQTVRLRHTIVLEDPFEDPPHLDRLIPSRSPSPFPDVEFTTAATIEDEIQILEKISKNEARSRAIALEILGDIPDADMKPPDNVLFICKLNPYTEEEDLNTIFSQFGEIASCNIIKDWKTGDSLQYGFIEFKEKEACENAYFKMKDVLIDDRRIHVDFCQSVSHQWFALQAHGNRATRQDALEANRLMEQNLVKQYRRRLDLEDQKKKAAAAESMAAVHRHHRDSSPSPYKSRERRSDPYYDNTDRMRKKAPERSAERSAERLNDRRNDRQRWNDRRSYDGEARYRQR